MIYYFPNTFPHIVLKIIVTPAVIQSMQNGTEDCVMSQPSSDRAEFTTKPHLDNPSIARYSRQLILPEIGVRGQVSLQNSSALIVGAGGLGCPAAVYLAAAGIGKLGIVDYDEVELSNLHRQILHTERRIGTSKAASVASSCTQLNSGVVCVPHHTSLTSENALDIIKQYDIILDATDNVATRYLLNDACILAQRPLVSGSALRFEGQLTVYNYQGGPCYRCLYPKPPPPEMVTNCSDGGVIGVVPGIIGCLQALEAIKIATGLTPSYSQKLLLFDGLDGSFRTIKLRPRQKKCEVCGETPVIKQLVDYEQFCGTKASDKDKELALLSSTERISVKEYESMVENNRPHLLVDVRMPVEMDICALPNSLNVPITDISKDKCLQLIRDKILGQQTTEQFPVLVICRRGNDSQTAVRVLKDELKDLPISIKDIRGGLTAWAKQIDHSFPVY